MVTSGLCKVSAKHTSFFSRKQLKQSTHYTAATTEVTETKRAMIFIERQIILFKLAIQDMLSVFTRHNYTVVKKTLPFSFPQLIRTLSHFCKWCTHDMELVCSITVINLFPQCCCYKSFGMMRVYAKSIQGILSLFLELVTDIGQQWHQLISHSWVPENYCVSFSVYLQPFYSASL